jgi:hypothetical protein
VAGDFPTVVPWNFRVALLGMQAVLWSTIALSFGAMAAHESGRARVR